VYWFGLYFNCKHERVPDFYEQFYPRFLQKSDFFLLFSLTLVINQKEMLHSRASFNHAVALVRQ